MLAKAATGRLVEFSGPGHHPSVAVIAASSPVAYPGIEACWDLVSVLRDTVVKGTVRVIPIADERSFLDRSQMPYFPGPHGREATVPDGYEHLQAWLSDVVASSDLVVDVRGGGLHQVDAHWVAALTARGTGSSLAAIGPSTPADFRVELDTNRPPVTLGVAGIAARHGVPSVIVSSGGIARDIASGSERILASLVAIFGQCGVLNDFPAAARPAQAIGPNWWGHDVERPCLWLPRVAAGDRVSAGSVLGLVTDIFGSDRETVATPIDGWVLQVTTSLGVGGGRPDVVGTRFSRTVTVVGGPPTEAARP